MNLNISSFSFISRNFYSCGGMWRGIVLEQYADMFNDLETWLQEDSRHVLLKLDCREVARHNLPAVCVYSKLMRAQNDGAYRKQELFSRLKWGLGPSRAVKILKTTSRMIGQGHNCPVPVLAARKLSWNGWHYNLLVTKEVNAPTLENIIQTQSLDKCLEAVKRAASELFSLHEDNFIHGDFLPRNTCFNDKTFTFLDNDKTFYCPVYAPFFLKRRNLDQFVYNLMLQGGLQECKTDLAMAFLEEYAARAKWSDTWKKHIFNCILSKAEKRWLGKKTKCGTLLPPL